MARRSTKARRSAQRRKINVEALGMTHREEMSERAYASAAETGSLPGLVRTTRKAVEEERAQQAAQQAAQKTATPIAGRHPCDACGRRRQGLVKVGAGMICPGCIKGVSTAAS